MGSIIIDTSSILFGLSNKVDVFRQAKVQLNLAPIVSKGVVKELESLSKGNGASNKYAKIGLVLLSVHKVTVDSDITYVDKWILKSAAKVGNVCTNDTKLRKALKSRGITTYTLSRQGELR